MVRYIRCFGYSKRYTFLNVTSCGRDLVFFFVIFYLDVLQYLEDFIYIFDKIFNCRKTSNVLDENCFSLKVHIYVVI